MKRYADYASFQTDDFLADPPFREWVLHPTPEMDAYWKGLLRHHPHLDEPFRQAKLLALGFEATQTAFSDSYIDDLYERIRPRPEVEPVVTRWQRWRWYSAAASVVLVTLAGFWVHQYFFTEQTLRTGYGQLRQVQLFDGSVVMLNANSQLRLPSRYQWWTNRQVWLDGEAYFTVRKEMGEDGKSYRKFTVHTHRVDVMVLGTRFNVYTRPRKTQVLLDEGRVELAEVAARPRPVVLSPGQLVEYSPSQPTSVIQQPVAEQVRQVESWTQKLLIFEEATMDELARRFQETYGLQLRLEGEAFRNQQFTGELPVDNLNKALLILSETFDRKAVVDGRQVLFVNNG